MNPSTHIEGYLPFGHALSPQQQYRDFPLLARSFTNSPLEDLWETDFSRLPRSLGQLRRKARAFAQAHLQPISAKLDQAAHLEPGRYHPEVHDVLVKAGQAGWLSYFLPTPLGSLPWAAAMHPPIWACSLIVEEFSQACGGLMLLLSAHHLGCMPLLLSGHLSTIRKFLLPVYQSNQRGNPHLVAFAITEPQAGSDVEEGHGAHQYRPGVVATPVEGGYLLNGRKCFISGGDLAKTMTVFAALKGESMESWTCFYVDCSAKGVTIPRTELKMGMRASGAAEVEFNDHFVPATHVVGELRKGWALNRATLNSSRIPVASMGVGFARAATQTAVEFARRYTLGGKPLIHYQDVQIHLATMVAETRAIRSLVWQEAEHARKPRQLHAALCKFHATDRAQQVCDMALDLLADHGGLHEHRIEQIYRDVRLTRIFEGTNQINRLGLIEDWQGQLLDNNTPIGV
jgi:alkylation response protein AidB-like acyl-CoA dehydrogenase